MHVEDARRSQPIRERRAGLVRDVDERDTATLRGENRDERRADSRGAARNEYAAARKIGIPRAARVTLWQ
jgi:hypothetical protein